MSSDRTSVGDVSDSAGVAVGTNSQANHQQVTINLPSAWEPPEPTTKEQIKTIRTAVLTLNQMFVSDRAERIPIQKEAAAWRERTQLWLISLTLLVGILVVGALGTIGRFVGWW